MFIDADEILHMCMMFLIVHPDAVILQYLSDDHDTIVCSVTFILIPILGFTASVYGTHMRVYMLHGLYQRRGQGAYCRPGGYSQNMFIDDDDILHVYDVSECPY